MFWHVSNRWLYASLRFCEFEMESALEAYRGCADSLQRLQNVLDNEDAVNSVLEEATNHLKAMRNSCAHGTAVQDGKDPFL